jgi:hypothetical protein
MFIPDPGYNKNKKLVLTFFCCKKFHKIKIILRLKGTKKNFAIEKGIRILFTQKIVTEL